MMGEGVDRADWACIPLGVLCCNRGVSVDPSRSPEAVFELYSVPHYETKHPEIVTGKEIGSSKQRVDKNTVLLCRINPRINRVWIVDDFSEHQKIASTEWLSFPSATGVECRFLKYFLSRGAFRDYLAHNASGVGGSLMRVKASTIHDYPFLLAPLVEQRAIVAKIEALFSELNKGVEQLETLRVQLKRYRQSVLKAAFEGKLTAEWRARQSQDPELLKAAETSETYGTKKHPPLTEDELADLPELPEGWRWVRLDTLGELARGKSKHRPRDAEHLYGGCYPFIQTGDVKAANRVIREYSQTYSEAGLKQSKLWPAGTLCITIAANIAETASLGFDCCFPDSIVGFTARKNVVLSEYVELFLQSAKDRISAFAPATAQKNINLTTLENLRIPHCSKDEQRQIVAEIEALFSALDQLEQTVESGLKQAEALRQSILKKAFEGRLLSASERTAVRADPDYEPAEKLLERIRAERTDPKRGRPR